MEYVLTAIFFASSKENEWQVFMRPIIGRLNVKQHMMFCRSGASRDCQSSRLAPLLQSFIIRGGHMPMSVRQKVQLLGVSERFAATAAPSALAKALR